MRTKVYITVENQRPWKQKEVRARWDVVCALKNGTTVKRNGWINLNDASVKRAALVALRDALKIFTKSTALTLIIEEPTARNTMINGWLKKWQVNDFKKERGEIKNVDLWKEIAVLIAEHYITYSYGKDLEEEVRKMKEELWKQS